MKPVLNRLGRSAVQSYYYVTDRNSLKRRNAIHYNEGNYTWHTEYRSGHGRTLPSDPDADLDNFSQISTGRPSRRLCAHNVTPVTSLSLFCHISLKLRDTGY